MKIKTYKVLLGLAVPFLLQSCFVAKNYERPEVETENLYRTDQISLDSTSLGMVSWRDLFDDPILKGHIDTALANNLDIRVALQQIAATEAYLKQGKAGNYPTLGINATATRTENSQNSQFGSVFSGAMTQYDLSAQLSWEADIWGKIRSNKRAFQATYLQSIEAHKAVKTELVAAIASMYYQLLSLDKQLEITQQTIETREGSLETTKALKEAGMLTEVAVQQTAALLYNAQSIQIDIENQTKILENAFSILLGEPAHGIERGILEGQEITTDLVTGVPYLLLQNRPDVLAAEFGLINAFELTNVARSSFYPSITLGATAGFQSMEFDKWLDASSFFNTLVGGLVQPVLEVQWLMNEDGSLRMKFFNRQADLQFIGEDQIFEQGAGISYSVDFNTFQELMRKLFNKKAQRKLEDTPIVPDDNTFPGNWNSEGTRVEEDGE